MSPVSALWRLVKEGRAARRRHEADCPRMWILVQEAHMAWAVRSDAANVGRREQGFPLSGSARFEHGFQCGTEFVAMTDATRPVGVTGIAEQVFAANDATQRSELDIKLSG